MQKTTRTIIFGILGTIFVLGAILGIMYLTHHEDTPVLDETTKSKPYNQDKTPIASDEKKVTLYIIHGETCPVCINTISYLESIIDEYDYLDVKLYEVWNNPSNQELVSKIEEELDLDIEYVPFIIVGKNYHQAGFSEDALLNVIEEAYNDPEYVDVMEPILEKYIDLDYEETTLKSSK